MLVEGSSVQIETANGMTERFNFVETFVVPAAAVLISSSISATVSVKVIKAFIKST